MNVPWTVTIIVLLSVPASLMAEHRYSPPSLTSTEVITKPSLFVLGKL